jgi:hypothetical protein
MLHVISLGAGVQSSTMALMAAHGEITPMPDCAIFADTQDEPDSVYEWLDWLERQLPFPIVRVSIGKLSLAATSPRVSEAGAGYLKPALPVHFAHAGIGQRHCTLDFKIVPILRYANMIRGTQECSQWIGISTDEAHRMKPSRKEWCKNRYPLVEKGMTRLHCLEWMQAKQYPKPPRSACVYCPYHSDDEWLRLKRDEPHEFEKAVAFERRYQEAAAQVALDAVPYLHKDGVPLSEVEFIEGRNLSLFGEECEGMCGV